MKDINMIYIIRHGKTDWNIEQKTQGHTDIPLNRLGKDQVQEIAKRLKSFKINKIFSSDLLRTKETADIISQVINVNVETDKRLREFNYGILEGIPRKFLSQEAWKAFNETPEKLNAETMNSVFTRIKSFFEGLEKEENILIVTHGGALRMIMYYTEKRDSFDWNIYANTYKDIKINNAAIFVWDKKSTHLDLVNSDVL